MTTVDPSAGAASPSRLKLLAAFAAIYIIWGSTYLAIRYAVETVPPFLMTGVRFLVAGGLLYAWSAFAARREARRTRVAGAAPAARPAPTTHPWRHAFVIGALLIVGGTALVGWAELDVPSGMTSLVLATSPLWMVLLESAGFRPGRPAAPSPRVIGGVLTGLAGLGILVAPSFTSASDVRLLGVGALALSSLLWCVGALYSRRVTIAASPARATGMQMIAGALLSLLVGFAVGEHRTLSLAAITPASALAVGYLVVAGALVGFSAYLWLMRVSTPSRVATHAYVNPVVAVLLGWAVAGEAVTGRTLVAMAVIVAAVALIVSAPRRPATFSPRARARAIIPAWRAR